ncbi:hypothetical protein DW203_05330 [Citrobacter portucalensis]|nr:hypothetical protein DW203_05330 [Citrobacter portucalensis]
MIILLITICICNSVLSRCGKRVQFFTTYKPTWHCVLFLEWIVYADAGDIRPNAAPRHIGTRG